MCTYLIVPRYFF